MVSCIVLAVLLADPAAAQVRVVTTMGRDQFIEGEPAYVGARVTNLTADPFRFESLWIWADRATGSAPWWLERWGHETWESCTPVPYSRDSPYWQVFADSRGPKAQPAILSPAESVVLWWDLLRVYDLPPGRYRVRLRLGAEKREVPPMELRGEPVEFTVAPRTGRDQVVWETGQAEQKHGRYLHPCGWIYRVAPEEVTGSVFGAWHAYLRVLWRIGEHQPAGPLAIEDADWVLLSSAPIETLPSPARERLRWTYDSLVGVRAAFGTPEYPRQLRAALRKQLTSDDPEWAAMVLNDLGRLEAMARAAQRKTDWWDERRGVYTDWRWPWYILPRAERPAFDEPAN